METAIEKKQENGVQVMQQQADPLISLALEKGAGIETIERLVALVERGRADSRRQEFFEAYSRFQQIVPQLKRTSVVDFTNKAGTKTNYKFIDLDTMCQAIKEPLKETGLTYRWKIKDIDGGKIEVTCLVTHTGGHTEETSLSAGADDSGGKNAIQQRGSTVSYLKRYTLDSALGLSSTTDNDGRGSGSGKTPEPQKRKDLTADNEENSKEFGKILVGVIDRKGKAKIADIEKHYVLTDEQKAKIELANKSATQKPAK